MNINIKNLKHCVKIFFLVAILVASVVSQDNLLAQTPETESLKLALKKAAHDSDRCRILNTLIETEMIQAVWTEYNKELKTIAEKNLSKTVSPSEKKVFKKYLANSINNLGVIEQSFGRAEGALEYYNKSLKILEELGDKRSEGLSLVNIAQIYLGLGQMANAIRLDKKAIILLEETGDKLSQSYALSSLAFIYNNQGDVVKALELHFKSLSVREAMGDKNGIAESLSSIGSIYWAQNEMTKTIEYYGRSLKIRKEIGDKRGVAECLNNFALFHLDMKEDKKALDEWDQARVIQEEIQDIPGLALTLSNIGDVYRARNDIPKAMEYYDQSFAIRKKLGIKKGMAYSLQKLSSLYYKLNNYSKSIELCKESMEISKELGNPILIMGAADLFVRNYKSAGDYRNAMENYELYIKMKDSIQNESTRKAGIKNQLKYEYEKQAAADSVSHAKENEIRNAELSRQSAEIRAKKNQQYALYGGLGLVIIFSIFMYKRFKVTQKQKEIIEQQKLLVETQKHLVEEKQKEVMDSIRYAKRIQMALIPGEKAVNKILERIKKK